MKKSFFCILIFSALFFVPVFVMAAPYAYIPNYTSNDVSVVDTFDNTVVATIPVGTQPIGVAVSPTGMRAYVTNYGSDDLSVIDTSNNTEIARVAIGEIDYWGGIVAHPFSGKVYVASKKAKTISVIDTSDNVISSQISLVHEPMGLAINSLGTKLYITTTKPSNKLLVLDLTTNTVSTEISVGIEPVGVVVNSSDTRAYVANSVGNSISVVNTTNNGIEATIPIGDAPLWIAINSSGTRVYATNSGSNDVSVVDTSTNSEIAFIPVGLYPTGISVHPSGKWVYVINGGSNNISVIDAETNNLLTNITVGFYPLAFGNFIGPAFPDISLSPSSFSFGKIGIGASATSSLRITNADSSGQTNLNIEPAVISGQNNKEFKIKNDNCSQKTLASSENCTLDIVFSPLSLGSKSASLKITSNDSLNPTLTVNLDGKGVDKKVKFVTKKPKKNEVLIKKKNKKYFVNQFSFLFKRFPKKIKTKKYYLQAQKFVKYPPRYSNAQDSTLKKHWRVETNFSKYQAKEEKNKFKVKLTFNYTNKEYQKLKKRRQEFLMPLDKKDLTIKYYNPKTKTWRYMFFAKHNQKKNTFTITFDKFFFTTTYFAIGIK